MGNCAICNRELKDLKYLGYCSEWCWRKFLKKQIQEIKEGKRYYLSPYVPLQITRLY